MLASDLVVIFEATQTQPNVKDVTSTPLHTTPTAHVVTNPTTSLNESDISLSGPDYILFATYLHIEYEVPTVLAHEVHVYATHAVLKQDQCMKHSAYKSCYTFISSGCSL